MGSTVAWFMDSSPCDYFGAEFAPILRAIGWLELGRPFTIGKVDREVYDKIVAMRSNSWSPMIALGNHGCDLCQHVAESCGFANLFIPWQGFLFVCPDLIGHYVNAHGYAPPSEFCDAVLACPPMRSMEYLKAILANGGRALVQRQGPKIEIQLPSSHPIPDEHPTDGDLR
jgi:hypothetical protein